MANKISTLFFMMFVAVFANAQNIMKVEFCDGTETDYKLSDIKKISWEQSDEDLAPLPPPSVCGNWYKISGNNHSLLILRENGTCTRQTRNVSSTSVGDLEIQNGTYTIDQLNKLTVTLPGGVYNYDFSNYQSGYAQGFEFAPNMCSLENGSIPAKNSDAVKIYCTDYGNKITVDVCPYYGIAKYDFKVNGKTYANQKYRNSIDIQKSVGSHKIECEAIAYDAYNNSYPQTKYSYDYSYSLPSSYYIFKGKVYELFDVEFSTQHDYTGTNTGANWMIIKFSSESGTSGVNQVQIRYAVPEWEGVSNFWASGTYNIVSSGNYYKYIGMVLDNGQVYGFDGKMTISRPTSSSIVIDIQSDDVTLHFVGL